MVFLLRKFEFLRSFWQFSKDKKKLASKLWYVLLSVLYWFLSFPLFLKLWIWWYRKKKWFELAPWDLWDFYHVKVKFNTQRSIESFLKKTDGYKNDTRFSVPFSFIFKRLGLWNMDPPNKCGQQMKQSWAARPSSSRSHFNIKFSKKQKNMRGKICISKTTDCVGLEDGDRPKWLYCFCRRCLSGHHTQIQSTSIFRYADKNLFIKIDRRLSSVSYFFFRGGTPAKRKWHFSLRG